MLFTRSIKPPRCLIVMVVLFACEDEATTGGYGQPCNPGRTCTQPYTCDPTTNLCVAGAQGGLSQACFPNGQCNEGLTCNPSTLTCQIGSSGQGGLNQPCYSNGTCNPGLTCNSSTTTCQSSGTQGGLNQPCYSNNTCDAGLTCNQSLRCESPTPRGGVNQLCLPNNVCDPGLTCDPAANTCRQVMCDDGDCATFANENCGTCPSDCGNCCGNGTCEAERSETHSTCPQDCPSNCAGCTGCCQNGECISYAYQTDTVCGKPGEDCHSCEDMGAYCDPVGTCKCDASTCTGCCDGVDTGQHEECIERGFEQSDVECGTQGAACVDCGDKLTCSDGVCICNGTTCPQGCCYEEYMGGREIHSCVEFTFQNDYMCGFNGATCESCVDTSKVCSPPYGCSFQT